MGLGTWRIRSCSQHAWVEEWPELGWSCSYCPGGDSALSLRLWTQTVSHTLLSDTDFLSCQLKKNLHREIMLLDDFLHREIMFLLENQFWCILEEATLQG